MANPVERLIATYLDHLHVERGLSGHTVAGYRRDLGRYAEHLAAQGITDADAVTPAHITAYAVVLGETLAPASVARATVAVRSLHRFAVTEGLTSDDPAATIEAARQTQGQPKGLPLDRVPATPGWCVDDPALPPAAAAVHRRHCS